jgi:hypothetical protein
MTAARHLRVVDQDGEVFEFDHADPVEENAIEWTDATWNPTTGCDRVSPGCANCYALTLAPG